MEPGDEKLYLSHDRPHSYDFCRYLLLLPPIAAQRFSPHTNNCYLPPDTTPGGCILRVILGLIHRNTPDPNFAFSLLQGPIQDFRSPTSTGRVNPGSVGRRQRVLRQYLSLVLRLNTS